MEEYSAKLLTICLCVCDILLKLRLPNKILIIVYVNNSGLNIVVLQMSEYFCHATFRHSSVYCLIFKKVCAINKIYVMNVLLYY